MCFCVLKTSSELIHILSYGRFFKLVKFEMGEFISLRAKNCVKLIDKVIFFSGGGRKTLFGRISREC